MRVFSRRACRCTFSYDRIAGYFSSSILEAAGESLESVQGPIRLICDSGLEAQDVITAKVAQAALRHEWCGFGPEQRKGRIQRIGQIRDNVDIYNMRYADSVEDRVHALLSQRLRDVSALFGQIPDVLEDVWVHVALGEMYRAQKTIDAVPRQHPFKLRYTEWNG